MGVVGCKGDVEAAGQQEGACHGQQVEYAGGRGTECV